MASHCPRWWRLTSRRSRHPNRQRRCRRFSANSAEFSRRGIPRTTRALGRKVPMKVLVDVNAVLDVLLDRQPHYAASATVWSAIESGAVEGLLSAHAVTTIHDLVCKNPGAAKARQTLTAILRVFGVAMVDERVILKALEMQSPDFEDSVTAAELAECDLIVTRDLRGFRGPPVQALAPEAAAPLLA